jgi:hypothetical protein
VAVLFAIVCLVGAIGMALGGGGMGAAAALVLGGTMVHWEARRRS